MAVEKRRCTHGICPEVSVAVSDTVFEGNAAWMAGEAPAPAQGFGKSPRLVHGCGGARIIRELALLQVVPSISTPRATATSCPYPWWTATCWATQSSGRVEATGSPMTPGCRSEVCASGPTTARSPVRLLRQPRWGEVHHATQRCPPQAACTSAAAGSRSRAAASPATQLTWVEGCSWRPTCPLWTTPRHCSTWRPRGTPPPAAPGPSGEARAALGRCLHQRRESRTPPPPSAWGWLAMVMRPRLSLLPRAGCAPLLPSWHWIASTAPCPPALPPPRSWSCAMPTGPRRPRRPHQHRRCAQLLVPIPLQQAGGAALESSQASWGGAGSRQAPESELSACCLGGCR